MLSVDWGGAYVLGELYGIDEYIRISLMSCVVHRSSGGSLWDLWDAGHAAGASEAGRGYEGVPERGLQTGKRRKK